MKKIISAIGAAALLTTSVAFAESSGTFRQAYEYGYGAKSNLDPISNARVFQITEKIMNRLVRPGLDGKPSPDLAVDWSTNEDATVWTFKLRKGVTFHDGSSFDAMDVLYSLNRVLDPEADSPARSAVKMIQSLEAIDAQTVKIILNTPFADMPLQLMDYRLRMIPENSGDTIATSGIGTGPFKVEKFDAEGTTILAANENYWEGAPGVARMEIIAIPDGQARLQALLGGQIDMERGITPQQRVMISGSDKFTIQEIPTGNWQGLVFRTDVEPYSDPRVRKALRLVADRRALVDLVLGGGGVVSCDTPVEPNDQYRASISCPQNIEGAKALLAEAGYPDGLEINVHVATLEPTWPILAVAYQAQAEKAGIRVNVVQTPTDGFWNEVWMKKDIYATRWNERPADQVLHEVYLSTAKWNESYFKDEVFDKMLSDARRELEFEKRRALYVAAQEYLWENAGTLIPYHVTRFVGVSSRVSNLDNVKNDAVRWNLITVE
ncbi:peptide ABC transporter substrate-binding protein [Kiloniella spongiae]|uniref:Peptide ABC transporter substrate-binding protein n=1 Tax=Kiloniella spongiae TaxID=1489064 RepID=A0A0H2MQV1_9PROT|nr:ABC transporter substrate-binding protein [Kiloniella spongiae]KLN59050.1 peptide ABC transporter substrate-binding protein [Kiloniella spongiae]